MIENAKNRVRENHYYGSFPYPIFYVRRLSTIEVKFDKEYSTQWIDEVNFLKEHGVRYSFVKTKDGISTYKYTKNLKLFHALSLFYENIYYK